MLNTTEATEAEDNMTGNKEMYEKVYHILYGYGLPTICACGFLGNVLILIVLGQTRLRHSFRQTELSANIGLIALAVADLLFCFTAFPSTFLPKTMVFKSKGFLLYYGCYCAAVINIFIMTSTWITVTMATERYLAICHPLKSRKIISFQRTKAVIIIVYISSAVFNVPVFWRNTIVKKGHSNETEYHVLPYQVNANFDHAYRASWAIFGNFLPLIILLFCNTALMRQIHKSHALRKKMNESITKRSKKQHQHQEANYRITITLIAIVVMFFILVAPSELVKHVIYLSGGNSLANNYTYQTIEIITNIMQTVNFSANFILYCIVNPSFRKLAKELFCFQYRKDDNHRHNRSSSQMHSFCEHRPLAKTLTAGKETSSTEILNTALSSP